MVPDRDAQVIGTVLENRYRVLGLLGRGGMGDVYLGEDMRLRRRCALKLLHARLAEDRTSVERFLREAQMIASLDHPNIVDIYSFGEEPSGLVFFAMELLQGEDLDARLRRRAEHPFSPHDACVWAIQIAHAVACVHDSGLIHRDLKVSNVFLARRRDGGEICKLLDFGIARAEDNSELTETGVTLGTPSYMSPEQIRNANLDRRSDIYSFGVVLFKLLTGRVPFTGEPIQVAMQHCEALPPAPSSLAPAAGISPALDAIVLKAMAKKPGDRFQSMQEVGQALTDLLQREAPALAPVAAARPPREPQTPTLQPAYTDSSRREAVTAASHDAATPGEGTQTSPTAVFAPPQPRRSRPSLALAGAGLLGAAAVALALTRGDAPPPPPVTAPPPPVAAPAASPETPSPAKAEPRPPAEPRPELDPPPPEPAPEPPPADEALPPLEPEVAPPPAVEKKKAVKPAAPLDPLKQVERKAQKCRKAHGAVGGPKIVIDYAVGLDGKVTRSVPSVHDALGKCLAEAVLSTPFEPKLALGRKVSL
ncbi:serine/threonine protein kinase [Nannocystis exedens]|uniref:Serine/threonine protein kinase n=1 Tax=Nannocystis exedens TaxID=54 RepID=A0A1I2DSM6_9BACT|nr:serine/threonine-protein kinase [Nannocystis exedens]PCC68936.1 serine/threonine protein kinase [Nannocystis exedens]SFE83428.1 serine/threonine protein kinase [Nannocystis exedens]